GQDIWRTLDSFLYYCCNVFEPYVNRIQSTVKSARQKCDTCSKKTGTFPCNCSSSGSCSACQEILKDFQLKVTLTQKYVSSYDPSNARWNLLCSQSVSKCCGSPSCSCTSGSCPSNGCCEKCPKRLCAKIFLGMLPCLYFGLKIPYDRCDPANSDQWPKWQKKNQGEPAKITEASGLRDFLFAWGIHSYLSHSTHAVVLPVFLKDLFSPDSKGSFDTLYNLVSKKYFSRSISSLVSQLKPSPPSTVRSMLLWLYGLRFTSGFSSLVSLCRTLSLPLGADYHPDAVCYYIHASCFLLPVSVISAIETSEYTVAKFFSDAYSEFSKFSYPEDLFKLFDMLLDCVRKIYIPFNFLRFQCKLTPAQAGWQNCYFGRQCSLPNGNSLASTSGSSSSPSAPCSSCPNSNTYLCTAFGSNKDVHGKHCGQNGGGKGCINASSTGCSDPGHNTSRGQSGQRCSSPCPHPLQRFLCDGSESQPKNSVSPFRLPSSFARIDFSQTPPAILDATSDNFLTMGFKDLPEKARKGQDLYAVLACFCDDGFYPVARLCEFALYVSLRPPETLLELFVFFRKFISSSVFKNHFASYVDGEPGRSSGENLKIAVQRLFNHSSKSHPSDLKSLSRCSSTKGFTCGKYLFPLYNVDGVFDKKFLGLYLSFVCHLAPKLKALLEKFQGEFSACCSDSSSKCKKIVECPCALPFLYSWGFSFWSPGDLNCVTPSGTSRHKDENKTGGDHDKGDSNCTMKTCADLVAQLKKVLGLDSNHSHKSVPLSKLLSEIDNFLWHIRLPFIYAFLYIWILVISYFYYVQFYKLDLLHIDSHLHLPRSFKIPPSILFSDASSKLKDLSYFTL
ncbi:variant erythrocyte surface antigen-1 family protein, partial [Babesia divergens]